MIDESFRLTSVDVKHRDFRPARIGGYEKSSVEQFRIEVAEELERLTRANQELETKARGFHEQLRAFRERDKALNDALISAQQLRSEIREQAEREAQLILREARAEGERLLDATRAEIRKLQTELGQLEKSRRAYLRQLRAIVERQLAELDAIDGEPPPNRPTGSGGKEGDEDDSDPREAQKTPAWLDSLIKE